MKKITDDRWIKIHNLDDEYVFKVYPRNRKDQELGTSKKYATYEECITASRKFIHFILVECVKSKNSQYIEYEQYKDDKNCWHYRYICKNDDETLVFYQRYVEDKTNAQKGVTSLYNTLENVYGGISK